MQTKDDPRPISAIWFSGEEGEMYQVGVCGTTRIEPYEENGQMSPVLWFKVWDGEHLKARINAAHVEGASYREAADEADS